MNLHSESTVVEPEVLPPRGEASGPKAAEAQAPWGVNPILVGFLLDLANMIIVGIPGFILGAALGVWGCVYNRVPVAVTVLICFACGAYVFTPIRGPIPLATLIGIILVFSRKGGMTKNG
jgi:hypothetical protein